MYIASATELKELPHGTILIDHRGHAWQKHGTNDASWYSTNDTTPLTDQELHQHHSPFQHLHIPNTGPETTQIPGHHTAHINRVEVIDNTGRAYVSTDTTNVELAIQDEGRTLKIFHRGQGAYAPRALDLETLTEFLHTNQQQQATSTAPGVITVGPTPVQDLARKLLHLIQNSATHTEKAGPTP